MQWGANIFLVGHKDTKERIMLDAGDIRGKNKLFLENLNLYMDDVNRSLGYERNNGIYISKILLSHSHLDHCAGL